MTTSDQTGAGEVAASQAGLAGDPLASWRAGASKQAIVEFVERVTAEGSPDFAPPEERVAVFDNDGTLWCEKPMPIQLDFILRRLAAMAGQDPGLRDRQPWQAAYTRDYAWLGDVITKHYHGDDSELPVLAAGVLQAFAGISVEDFEAQAEAFLRSAQHPTLGRGYLACGYRPMVELLAYLDANGFANYIASGGGRDFMRPISQELYGVPRQRVIGSSTTLAWEPDEQGGRIVRKPEMDVLDDGPAKPVRIWGCWSCTTTPSASSTTPAAPSRPSSRPAATAGHWSASTTTGRRCSETCRSHVGAGRPGNHPIWVTIRRPDPATISA
jgi:phosphoglycolate phosphatase-like HAD superfamily hydrolase